MRRLILFTAILTSILSAQADGTWLETTHDFGAFDEDLGIVTCQFRLVNTGDEPLAIINARANCGCTRPEYSTKPIAPGDTAIVSVGFDPKGRPGKFKKYIYVDANTTPPRTTLEIHGTVIGAGNTLRSRFPVEAGPMRLRGTTIAYGQILKDHAGGKYLEGYNTSTDTLRPLVTGAPSHISVIIEPNIVPPGEQFVISTIFHSDKCNDWGLTTGSFNLRPTPDATPVNIETVAIIKEDFSKMTTEQMDKRPVMTTSTTNIDLGKLTRADKPVTRSFTITNSGDSPLIIRQISCPDKAVSIKISDRKIKRRKSATVTVTVDPSLVGRTELLNARINITANDPINPTETVRLVAEMK
ncbi:MAG: DUF1573 domain-containing protein [Lachnoclostridium sp.]|nr:DUF1573 domain-containing protein [Lachnoclostridium sp.]